MDAETGPAGSTFLWLIWALGWKNLLPLCLTTILSCGLTGFLVVRGRGTFAAAGMALAVFLPLGVGLCGGLCGLVGSYQHIGATSEAALLSEVADAFFASLAAPLSGLILCLPSIVIALTGSTLRAIALNPDKPLWTPPPPKPKSPPADSNVWDDAPEIALRHSSRD